MIKFDEFDYSNIERIFEKAPLIKERDKQVYNIVTSFDIETTSYDQNSEKIAFMYIWMFSFENYVIYGRTWEEFQQFLNKLIELGQLNPQRQLYIYVHNLSFEFQFIRKLFEWEKVFASDERKVIYGLTNSGLMFKDSYILSALSLEKVASNLKNHQIKKLVGNLDYDKIRTKDTVLTEEELAYCSHDVEIVVDYIHEQIDEYGSITRIPLTNTGRVRKFVKGQVYGYDSRRNRRKYYKYREMMKVLTLDIETYRQLKQAFQGGFTHANANYQGQIIKDVTSVDFTSSYPTVMVTEKFPSSKAIKKEVKSLSELEKLCDKFCVLFDLELFGVYSKIEQEHYLSVSKCKVSNDCVEDNGRIYASNYIKTTVTEVDFNIIKQCYTWENIKFTNVKVFYKEYLPKDLIKSIMELYDNKTKLKGIPEKRAEYMRSKGMLNSCYGMMVTDIIRNESIYDNNVWSTEISNPLEQINKYNTSKNRFLYYPWGVWVTAYARQNLWTGILEAGDDYVYSDTDSIKIRNYNKHQSYINAYNKEVTQKAEQLCKFYKLDYAKLNPKTIKGVNKPIGVWDYEGTYQYFKTLGAKRYMVYIDDKINITIAGLSKSTGKNYIIKQGQGNVKKAFDFFDDEMYIPAEYTGKNTHLYIDENKRMLVTDFQGHRTEVFSPSGVYLYGAEFTLSISREYGHYLSMLQQGMEFIKYSNEV